MKITSNGEYVVLDLTLDDARMLLAQLSLDHRRGIPDTNRSEVVEAIVKGLPEPIEKASRYHMDDLLRRSKHAGNYAHRDWRQDEGEE